MGNALSPEELARERRRVLEKRAKKRAEEPKHEPLPRRPFGGTLDLRTSAQRRKDEEESYLPPGHKAFYG